MASLPQLAAFDLDGTLLNRAKQLTDRTVAAVRALAEAGTVCVLASGRMYRDCMTPYVEQLGLAAPVIAYNGAMVLDPASGEIWHETPIASADLAPILAVAREGGLHLNLYHDDRMYCPRPSRWSELYCGRTAAQPIFGEGLFEFFATRPSTKALLIAEPAVVERLNVELQPTLGQKLYVTVSDPEYLEFMNRAVSKGNALRALCTRLGIDLTQTAAFGDALNDIPMLQAAGVGYAMAEARSEVQAAADQTAPSHDDDGVARVLEGWLAA